MHTYVHMCDSVCMYGMYSYVYVSRPVARSLQKLYGFAQNTGPFQQNSEPSGENSGLFNKLVPFSTK